MKVKENLINKTVVVNRQEGGKDVQRTYLLKGSLDNRGIINLLNAGVSADYFYAENDREEKEMATIAKGIESLDRVNSNRVRSEANFSTSTPQASQPKSNALGELKMKLVFDGGFSGDEVEEILLMDFEAFKTLDNAKVKAGFGMERLNSKEAFETLQAAKNE